MGQDKNPIPSSSCDSINMLLPRFQLTLYLIFVFLLSFLKIFKESLFESLYLDFRRLYIQWPFDNCLPPIPPPL